MKLVDGLLLFGGQGYFPDSRIGASLKPLYQRIAIAWLNGLPRFANRGLIEANIPSGNVFRLD